MNAALRQICCCRWDKSIHLIAWRRPECPIHGNEVDETKMGLELRRQMQMCLLMKSEAHTQLVTWYRNHKTATRRLKEAQAKLKAWEAEHA